MDSQGHIVGCMRLAIQDLGLESRRDEQLSNVIGLGLTEAVQALYPGTDDAFRDVFVEAYRKFFFAPEHERLELFPNARKTLDQLRDKGYWLAVATGKSRRGLDAALEMSQLKDYFLATRCADETFSKPNPEMLLQIMDELGVDPKQTVMIGDTEYDLQMASNAGVNSIGVSYGVHSVERLHQHNPVTVIDHLPELITWLDS